MTRVTIDKITDQCWFCKDWFFQDVLAEITVVEKHFGGETLKKLICPVCAEGIKTRSLNAEWARKIKAYNNTQEG